MSAGIKRNKTIAQANNLAVGRDVIRLRGLVAALVGPTRSAFVGYVAVRAIADSKDQSVIVLVYKLARRGVLGKTCARQVRDAAELDYGIPCGARNASGTILYCTTNGLITRKRKVTHVERVARVDNARGATELSGIRSRRSVSLARNRHAVKHDSHRLRVGIRTIANIANNAACVGQLARKVKRN